MQISAWQVSWSCLGILPQPFQEIQHNINKKKKKIKSPIKVQHNVARCTVSAEFLSYIQYI